VATNAYLLYSSLAYTGRGALLGVLVMAAGGVLIAILEARRKKEASR
jgi:APA family basic amino acid/polyamine antiporter